MTRIAIGAGVAPTPEHGKVASSLISGFVSILFCEIRTFRRLHFQFNHHSFSALHKARLRKLTRLL